ncbi:hypothetical protein ABK040_008411 [Willaertia magna]
MVEGFFDNNKDEKKIERNYGNFQCNKYYYGLGGIKNEEYPMGTLFTLCHFENLCMNQKGEFILPILEDSQPLPTSMHRDNPFVYAQGRFETKRGNIMIKFIDDYITTEYLNEEEKNKLYARDVLKDSNNMKTVKSFFSKEENKKKFRFSENFTYLSDPVFSLYRYAAGNVGHLLLENLNIVMQLMINFLPKIKNYSLNNLNHLELNTKLDILLNNHILFLEDLHDLKIQDNWIASYHYNLFQSDKFSNDVFSLVTKKPILQKCRNEKGNFFISTLPCRNAQLTEEQEDKINIDNDNNIKKENVIDICFKNFFIGMSSSNFLSGYGKEHIYTLMRDLMYKKLNIKPLPNSIDEEKLHILFKKPIHIAIHKKSINSRHGEIIWNVDELTEYLRSNLESEFLPKYKYLKDKELIIESISLDSMTLEEQVKYFSNVDIYISDQGSASYISLVMRDFTYLIMAPICFYQQKRCDRGFTKVLTAYNNVNVLSYLDLYGAVTDCNKRILPYAPGNCDPILNPQALFRAIKGMLKTRYAPLIKYY